MATDPFPTGRLPRVRLAHLPTPIERLPNLTKLLGGPDIYVKRDDLTGLATGGNKVRKLEFLIGQALQAEADCVITAGAVQSNHARQTAAAARKFGLEPHLVLGKPAGGVPEHPQGNLLLDHLLGAVIHWTDEPAPYAETIAQVAAELRDAGRQPYEIPYGGSSAHGMMGYVEAMREVAEQVPGPAPFAAHVFATSSGGMQAGMMLGAYLVRGLGDNWGGRPRLLGISVADPASVMKPRLVELVRQGATALGLTYNVNENAAIVNDGYLGEGYAVVGEREREAIRLAAQQDGLLVDPVYTGRALAGLIDLIRQGAYESGERVLFWHTGGTAGLFAFGEVLELDTTAS